MVRSISQTIKLAGAEEIQRLLAGIGQAGSKAFGDVQAAAAAASVKLEQISGAVASVEKSFASVTAAGRNFGGAIQGLGNNFNQFERALSSTITKTTLLVGGIVGAAAGLAKFALSGIKAADDLDEQAQALGLSAQRYQELGFAASESGVKAGTFASAIRKFSQEVLEESSKQAKGIVTFLDAAAKGFDDWGGRIKLVGNQSGQTFSIIAEGAQKLQQKLAAQGITRPLFLIQEQLRKLALGGAQAREEFERLTGLKLPPAADGLDKLREQAEGSKDSIRRLGLELKKTSEGQIDVSDALSQLADKFKELPDGAAKTAAAIDIFGRAAGPAMIPFLNQGRDGIDALLSKARELGVFLSKDQIEASGKAARAYDILARSATNAKNSIGAAFAPVTTAIANGLSDLISKNKSAIDGFAETLNRKAIPYVTAFFNLLAGRDDGSDAAGHLIQIRDRFASIGTTVSNVALIVGNAFSTIIAVLDQVAAGINSIFGTNISGAELGILLVITKLVGGFTLLAAGVRLAVGLFTTLFAGLRFAASGFGLLLTAMRAVLVIVGAFVSWPALLVAALGVALVAIIQNWDAVKAAAQQAWDFLKNLLANPLETAWNWLSRFFKREVEAIKKDAAQLLADIKKIVDVQDRDTVWGWLTRQLNKEVEAIKRDVAKLVDDIKNLLRLLPSAPQGPFFPGQEEPIPGVGPGSTPFGLLGQRRGFDKVGDPASQNIEDRRNEVAQQIEAETTAVLEAIKKLAADAATAVAESFEQLKSAASAAMQEVVATFTGGADLIGAIVTGAFQRTSEASTNLIAQLVTAVQQMVDALNQAVTAVIASVDASIAAVISRLEAAVAKAQELASAAAAAAAAAAGAGSGGGGDSGSGGFAGGGYTGDGGRLTPAGIVHRGEHVQPANVVRQPGVLAFLEALRRSGGDLRAVLNRFARGFASGGLVESMRSGLSVAALPSFASGGLVPAPQALSFIGTVDLSFAPGIVARVGVDRDAVDQIRRAGLHRQLVRAGKVVRSS